MQQRPSRRQWPQLQMAVEPLNNPLPGGATDRSTGGAGGHAQTHRHKQALTEAPFFFKKL